METNANVTKSIGMGLLGCISWVKSFQGCVKVSIGRQNQPHIFLISEQASTLASHQEMILTGTVSISMPGITWRPWSPLPWP